MKTLFTLSTLLLGTILNAQVNMKKLFTTLFICLLTAAHSYSQDCCPYIDGITILPENPTTTDTIRIVTSTTTPNLGNEVSYSFNQQADTFNLIGCFYNGFLTALQTYIDTTNIGTLPAGTYYVYYTAKLSDSQTECSMIDSNSMTASFEVSTGTGVSQPNAFSEKIYYPNPTSDLLMIAIDGMKTIYISNLNGQVMKEIQTEAKTISLAELPSGNYIIRVYNTNNELLSTANIIRGNR